MIPYKTSKEYKRLKELLDEKMREKAKKSFCLQQCKIVCWESDYDNGCPDFEKFIAELNN